MGRTRWTIAVFVAGVLAVIGAMAGITWHALRLERGEADARRDAALQERVRLALWRMDSALTPVLSRESARPYFQYQPFYPADRAYTRMYTEVNKGDVLVPSPLLRPSEDFVKLYFEVSQTGELSSPQLPTKEQLGLAEGLYVSSYAIRTAERNLSELDTLLRSQREQATLAIAPTTPLDTLATKPGNAAFGRAAMRDGTKASQEPESTTQATPTELAQTIQIAGSSISDASEDQSIKNAAEFRNRAQVQSYAQKRSDYPPTANVIADEKKAATAMPGAPPALAATTSQASPSTPESEASPKRAAEESDKLQSIDRTLPKEKAERNEPGMSKDTALDAHVDATQFNDTANDRLREIVTNPLAVSSDETSIVQDAFQPAWLGSPSDPQLVMIREVHVGGTKVRQGFWLDWPQLRAWLLSQTADVGAGSTLVPLLGGTQAASPAVLGRTLAAIPAEFIATTVALNTATPYSWSPLRVTLGATWLAVILASIAIAWVLRASLDLAERRGRFVSAVTHELRTPLTTFCLYSQMLADGMVTDEEAKASYVRTLKQESNRLAGIVENVLDYAKLGRRSRIPMQDVSVRDLVSRIEPVLLRRCEQANLQLEISVTGDQGAMCSTEPTTVERVMYNLVDNACKYAADHGPIRLDVAVSTGRRVLFSVQDDGPGVLKADHGKIFRPFVRGSNQADGSVPGLGLGLALSRSLARELGGDLTLDDAPQGRTGARFTLSIPLIS
jgi:signal transduction histidine kinase